MECSFQRGKVKKVRNFIGRQELVITLGQSEVKAMNYPACTGSCQLGDWVVVNTTGTQLNLGTGGWHYVLTILGRDRNLSNKKGHLMKLRYTPVQGRVLSIEEEASPYHELLQGVDEIQGLPVAVGSLHSQLAPLAWALNELTDNKRLVYLMSDGGALPIGFSQTVSLLKKQNLLHKTITFGHAFGGDLEAVNIYSALLAAKYVAKADFVIVAMGPGVVGTKTRWGTTALEQGVFLNAVDHLQGLPIFIPRLSQADSRERHLGLSHHSQTVLRRLVERPILLPLPLCYKKFPDVDQQIHGLEHQLSWQDTGELFAKLRESKLPLNTMGRGMNEDPLFFHGVLAAALCLRET